MTAFPPTIRSGPPGQQQAGENDNTKYLIGRSRFARPTLRAAPNGPMFEWPLGTEGIRVTGSVGIAQHMYLGDNAPVVQVVHRDARRFEMRGMFAGFTGSQNMRDLIEVITAPIPQGYWVLRLPATIFPREQLVVIEAYDFDHPDDDRTHSWSYSISMVRTGVGGQAPEDSSIDLGNVSGNTVVGQPRGQSARTFTTRSGADTLRLIANIAYGDPNQWRLVYEKNRIFFDRMDIPLTRLQYTILGPGMQLNV